MASIFTRIINGEIPCYKIAEDDNFIAFLDINPVKKGHTLVVPKLEIDYIFDLNDTMLQNMMVFAKKVASGLKKSIQCNRIGISVIGLEVPHAHIHLIPISNVHDINFEKQRVSMNQQEFEDLAMLIKTNLDSTM
jgi:histidine triad (HIT) family protein